MALIRCPECGKEISSQANNCPGCGYPISKEHACSNLTLELFFCDDKYAMKFKRICNRLYGYDSATSMSIVESAKKRPTIIAENLNEEDALSAYVWFKSNHILVRVTQDGAEIRLPGDYSICCPMCGSQQFTPVKKGFSAGKAVAGGLIAGSVGLVAGAIGSNKIEYVCLSCGNQF